MKIEEALKKCRDKFMNFENVVGIGIGNKKGQEIIVIMVSKLNNSTKNIPSKFENIEIEIRETGNIKSQKHEN